MKYRKKPVIVDAIQYDGVNLKNVAEFMCIKYCTLDRHNNLVIGTLEGDMRAAIGDYIIRGVEGEYYPCKPDIFEKTYEPVPEE